MICDEGKECWKEYFRSFYGNGKNISKKRIEMDASSEKNVEK